MRRKCSFILILLFTILVHQGISQVKPFRFGIKISPNISWLRSDTEHYKTDGASVGFNWGLISDFTIADNYFFATGLNVVYNYARLEFPYKIGGDTTGTLNRKYLLRYIQAPLTLKMRTGRFDAYSFYGKIGLGAAFRINARTKDVFSYTNDHGDRITNPETTSTITDDIYLLRASVILGLGFEYYIDQSTSIIAGIHYNNGFTDVLKSNSSVNNNIEEHAVLNYFEINFGVIF